MTHIYFSTLSPRQNARHFANNTFKNIFLNGNIRFFFTFHWSVYLRVHPTILQHWVRYMFGATCSTIDHTSPASLQFRDICVTASEITSNLTFGSSACSSLRQKELRMQAMAWFRQGASHWPGKSAHTCKYTGNHRQGDTDINTTMSWRLFLVGRQCLPWMPNLSWR